MIDIYQYTPEQRDRVYKTLNIPFNISTPFFGESERFRYRSLCTAMLAYIFRNNLPTPVDIDQKDIREKMAQKGITDQEIADAPEITETDYYVVISLIRQTRYAPKLQNSVPFPTGEKYLQTIA